MEPYTKNTPYALLVFDWDGTLIDSEDKIIAAFHATADDLGLLRPSDASIRDIIGFGISISVRILFPNQNSHVWHRIVDRYQHYFDTAGPLKAFPEVPETLRALRKDGYLMAVATGKTRSGLEKDLLSSGLREIWFIRLKRTWSDEEP
uniref:Haloacid dehalogenase-like hydrolase n=1 Tax=Candidatus Kentrum sp. TUN TaxID=2126343 RepID=A0A450ZAY3_9GAMM|nr:MAG: Haloacid dehalogenase-like hydrolase [Candidatus Kentron sp. TUN]